MSLRCLIPQSGCHSRMSKLMKGEGNQQGGYSGDQDGDREISKHISFMSYSR